MSDTEQATRVLVTGGASGIGAAIALRFARDGARVGVLDHDRKALDRLRDTAPGVELALAADVAEAKDVRRAFEAVDDAWNGLDVLCNNAGISIRQPFLDTTLVSWERTLAVNLTGIFLVAQQAARRMVANAGGVIVNTASVSGMIGMPNYTAYKVSKAGVIELTRTMALELAPPGTSQRGMSWLRTHSHAADRVHRTAARRLRLHAALASGGQS